MSDLEKDDIPVRRSNYVPPENYVQDEQEFISDEELATQISAALQSGADIESLIGKLERELGKREERKEEYVRWLNEESASEAAAEETTPETIPQIVEEPDRAEVATNEETELTDGIPTTAEATSPATFLLNNAETSTAVNEENSQDIAEFPEEEFLDDAEILPVADPVETLISGAKVEAHLSRTPETFIEHSGISETDIHLRNSKPIRLFWLWFAPMTSMIVIIAGAKMIADSQDLWQLLFALILGTALSLIPVVVSTIASKWSGQPTMVVSRATFGHLGNILPAILGYLSRLGIILFLLYMVANASKPFFDQLPFKFDNDAILMSVAAVIAVAIAMTVALFGYKLIYFLSIVVAVVSFAAVGGLVYFTAAEIDFKTIWNQPAGNWWATVGASVILFSIVGIIWAQSGGDFARNQRPGGSNVASGMNASIGFLVPILGLSVWGILLALSNQEFSSRLIQDPFQALLEMVPGWMQAPLLGSIIFSLITGIIMSLYSAGLSLPATGISISRGNSTWITALLATIISVLFFWNHLWSIERPSETMLLIAVPIAAWLGLFSGEMFIRSRRFDSYSLVHRGGVYQDFRAVPFVSLILIIGIGYAFIHPQVEWLSWLGYGYLIPGLTEAMPGIEDSHLGVLLALVLGILVSLCTSLNTIREQEMVRSSSLKIRD